MLLKKNNNAFIVNTYCGVSSGNSYNNMGYNCAMVLR